MFKNTMYTGNMSSVKNPHLCIITANAYLRLKFLGTLNVTDNSLLNSYCL